MKSPPPLPGGVRVQAEKLIMACSVASAVVAAGLVYAAVHGLFGWSCAWKAVTGWPCAGCGGTRALALLAGGEWLAALRMNPGAVATVPLLLALNLYAAVILVGKLPPWRPRWMTKIRWRWLVVGALLANWLYLLAAGVA